MEYIHWSTSLRLFKIVNVMAGGSHVHAVPYLLAKSYTQIQRCHVDNVFAPASKRERIPVVLVGCKNDSHERQVSLGHLLQLSDSCCCCVTNKHSK